MQVKVLRNETLGPRRVASFSIQSLESDFKGSVKNAMVANLLTNQSDIPPAKRSFSNLPHLASLPFIDVDESISMIIGISLQRLDGKRYCAGSEGLTNQSSHGVWVDCAGWGWQCKGVDGVLQRIVGK